MNDRFFWKWPSEVEFNGLHWEWQQQRYHMAMDALYAAVEVLKDISGNEDGIPKFDTGPSLAGDFLKLMGQLPEYDLILPEEDET